MCTQASLLVCCGWEGQEAACALHGTLRFCSTQACTLLVLPNLTVHGLTWTGAQGQAVEIAGSMRMEESI